MKLTVTMPIEMYEELREATIFASVEARIAADRLPHSAYYPGKCAYLLDLLDRASLKNMRIGNEEPQLTVADCVRAGVPVRVELPSSDIGFPPAGIPNIDRLYETAETQRVADRLEERER